jgi:hypothetical protein
LKNNKSINYETFGLNDKMGDYEKFDKFLNYELIKLLRNRKNRLLNGLEDNLAMRIEFYNEKFPEKFAEHFRCIRNRRNHTNYKRASDNHDISLKDFFKLYHGYILILYTESRWLWEVDVEKYEWNGIQEFAIEILK